MSFEAINPALLALGFAPTDRLVVFHADDLGMCQSSVPAVADLLDFGLLSSCSIMMPCPWAAEAAAAVKSFEHLDMGVHLTLNSEWNGYRWGPLSTRDPASGLLDGRGAFHVQVEAVHEHADPGAVQYEISAQVKLAQSWGLPISHLDSHMGTLAFPRYLDNCIPMAQQTGLFVVFPRYVAAQWQMIGIAPKLAQELEGYGRALEERGVPLVDRTVTLPHDEGGDHVALARQILDDLPPGITHFMVHPACDTPELRAMTPGWAGRVANYDALRSTALKNHVERSGIQVIGYNTLRSLASP